MTTPTGQPTTVVYSTPVATGGAPPLTGPSCTPAADFLFPVGSTPVTCTVTDSRQRPATCTFQVTVIAPPKLTVTRFVAFGDSMTAGEDGNNSLASAIGRIQVFVSSPYPSLLRTLLAARYTTQSQSIVVANQGRSGEPLARRSAALPPPAPARFSQVIAGGQYDVALILEGANDLQNRDDKDIPPAVEALRTMTLDARSRGMKVVLATLPPENPAGKYGSPYIEVRTFNAQLKAMAAAENVPVADVYTAFGGDTPNFALLGGDGLHPNQDGYQKIADTFLATIRQNFEVAPPTTTSFSPLMMTPRAIAPARRR